MRVQLLNNLGQVYDVPATRVLVTMDDGTPAMVATEILSGAITCAHARDRDFLILLQALGIDRTVIVSSLKPKPAAAILERT